MQGAHPLSQLRFREQGLARLYLLSAMQKFLQVCE
jgi:hypothetical protein